MVYGGEFKKKEHLFRLKIPMLQREEKKEYKNTINED
jgi:hypothetical protein